MSACLQDLWLTPPRHSEFGLRSLTQPLCKLLESPPPLSSDVRCGLSQIAISSVIPSAKLESCFEPKPQLFANFRGRVKFFSAAVSQMTITASERASAEHKKYEIISRSEPSYCSRDCPAVQETGIHSVWFTMDSFDIVPI